MKASEGRLGRVFMLRLEEGDDGARSIEQFAEENGIHAGQVFVMTDRAFSGILASDAEGIPGLRMHEQPDPAAWVNSEIVIQELLGIRFLRVKDPSSGRETLARIASTKTRVMENPAPAPESSGPGTIPVYLVNAEFN